ncbi:MAG: nitronate monooxygenase [Proteobacteria bacterium]|nr:nitronate monooxygenase [Pseudomonadota bacterium]
MPGNFLRTLGVDHPIVLGPMAGGAGSPKLVAAVSNAGGLGSFGAAYLAPQQILDTVNEIRSLTSKPIALNLFAGGYEPDRVVEPGPMMAVVSRAHERLGLAPPTLPPNPVSPFDEQLEAIIEAKPALFSFTFGVPGADQIARLQKAGIPVCGTATTVEEAKVLASAGVDAIAAQGEEAGAHRGTFLRSAEESMVPTYELVRGVVAATGLPVFASGGLMDGADVKRALEAGAQAAQLGTAFLLCPESGIPVPYRDALRARKDTTVITRVYSGRAARGLRNRFIDECDGVPVLPFRQQNDLTRAMRTESGKKGLPDYISLWAGRGVTRAREMPAAELVRMLVSEIGGR